MDADSEGIRLVAQELQELGRKRKILAEQLENLRVCENQSSDVSDAVFNLKDRLGAFKRGWKKASPMTKKSLLSDLLWAVIVTPKGLSIEFRLKHGLNSKGLFEASPTSAKPAGAVISLDEHRHSSAPPADAGAVFHNEQIQKLQVVRNGSERRT